MSDILILGPNTLLGSQLAACLLASTQHKVQWLAEDLIGGAENGLATLVLESATAIARRQGAACGPEPCSSRFTLLACHNQPESLRADEIWLLSGRPEPLPFQTAESDHDRRQHVLRWIENSGARSLNYVGSIYAHAGTASAENAPAPSEEEREVLEDCARRGISTRSFLTSWTIGDEFLPFSAGGEMLGLLSALNDVIAEVQERMPEYFDYQAMQIAAPPEAVLNIVPAARAVECMLAIAAGEEATGARHFIVNPKDTPWQDFCDLLGEIYGISLLTVENRDELTAIDLLLAKRLPALEAALAHPGIGAFHDGRTEGLEIDAAGKRALLKAIRAKQEKARLERNQRAAELAGKLEKRTIHREGSDLTYFVAGETGDYLLLLNALGQGLNYWYRLIDRLMHNHRVIIWETRGLFSESKRLRLSDHVDDIEAIMREEKIESCHLAGWCTGPQAAVEFYVRRPEAVRDMVFLNCAFKFADHPEFETAYGRNLESLCRVLIDNPAMTPSIRRSLSVPPDIDVDLLDESDLKGLAMKVLSLTNVDLRNDVLAPFQTEVTMTNYAHQILDLSNYPTLEHAPKVEVPILVLGCECDQVAKPAKASTAAQLFPRTRHIELPGATHYSFYDRPELVATMMEDFFRDPAGTNGNGASGKSE